MRYHHGMTRQTLEVKPKMFTLHGAKCAKMRKSLGLSRNELVRRAAEMGYQIAPETVRDVERHHTGRRVTLDVAMIFAKVLRMDVNLLVKEVNTVAA